LLRQLYANVPIATSKAKTDIDIGIQTLTSLIFSILLCSESIFEAHHLAVVSIIGGEIFWIIFQPDSEFA
jgi:hypothetical protein